MSVLVKTLLLTWCTMAVCGQKTQMTRTALHVARSLNPEATETMTVRTRTGDVATLIVKRRSGRQQPDFTPNAHKVDNASNASRSEQKIIPLPNPVDVTSSLVETKGDKQIKNVIIDNSAPERESKTSIQLPESVFIRSSPVLVKGQQNNLWKKRSRSLQEVGPDGIPVVTGVRMPDDESDKQVWRNARVINGMLRPYDKTQPKHTFDINSSQVNEKKKPFLQSGLEWQHTQPITQRPPNKGLLSQKDEWQKIVPVKQLLPADFRPSEVLAVIDSPSVQEWHQVQYPQEVVAVVDEPIVKVPQEDQYIRDRILEYIKKINQQELVNRQQSRNSRMIAEAADQPKMEARVLHTPGASVYPTSLLYSPPSSQPSRVSFEEGVRTPVLQYAHPELGVQSANVVTTPETEQQPETVKTGDRRDQALAYFAHDIHSDRSPYAFEPGLEEEAKVEDYGGNAKRSHSGGILQRPKKNLAYFYPEQSVSSGYNNKQYGKYGYNDYSGGYGGYYAYQVSDGRPFWERLSDTIKSHVQTGIEKMTVITKPVVEPLMEASHKISENLGFSSGNRELSSVKEKMGIVGSPSILLPALGLVAGGAALGLGAVAVGRYLDVDLLKRSKDSSDYTLDDLPAEHKRAIEAISEDLANDNENVPAKTREKRSVGPEDVLEEILQSLETASDVGESSSVLSAQGVWNNTPCAKSVFCQAMVQQPHDAILLMEKKMATYFQMIHPSMTDTVGFHLDDVMSAVRSHDCSAFRCSVTSIENTRHRQQRPSPR